jgi:predicted metal-dependent TIM-barrel fold hydrolase
MNDQPTVTLATDEATASVRPGDARYNRQKFTPEQLREIREQEIYDATVALMEQRKAEEEKNQAALDESGYVNPTVQPEESPVARAFDQVYGKQDDTKPAAKKAASSSSAKSS